MAEYIELEKVQDIIADIYKDSNDAVEETCIKIWEKVVEKSGGERMTDVCKWLADEVCVNVDCPYLADFCPSTEHPRCCVHFEEQETNNNENQA